jgi:hypothetical protein
MDNLETQGTVPTTQPALSPPQPASSQWSPGEKLTVVGIPVIGYWFAYSYERGYCSQFLIPHQFINLSFMSIFGVVASISGLIYVALMLTYWHSRALTPHPVRRRLLATLVVILTIAFTLFPEASPWISKPVSLLVVIWSVSVCGVLLTVLALFILPLYGARRVGMPYVAYLRELDKNPSPPTHIIEFIAYFVGRLWAMVFFLMICLYVVCNFSGGLEARTQMIFPVLNDKPDRVVLRIYGDNAICARFDPEKHLVGAEFSIVKIGDRNSSMTMRVVGPLLLEGTPVFMSPTTAPAKL